MSPKLLCVEHFVYSPFIVLDVVLNWSQAMITRNAHEWIILISLLYVTSVVSRTQQRISSLMLFHKSGLIVNLISKVKSREGR